MRRPRLALAALALLASVRGGAARDAQDDGGDGSSFADDGQVLALAANESITGAGQCEKMLQLESVCEMYQNCRWDAPRLRCNTVAGFLYPTVAPTREPTTAGLSGGTCASQNGLYNCTKYMDCEYRAPTGSCVSKPPTRRPSQAPSQAPTAPTSGPTRQPTTEVPSAAPSPSTAHPSSRPTTPQPSHQPTSPTAPVAPTRRPTAAPSASPSRSPSGTPTRWPSASPTASPTRPQPALALAQAAARLPFAANATYRLVLGLSSAVPCKTALQSAQAALGAEPLLSSQKTQRSRTMAVLERGLQLPPAEAGRLRGELCAAGGGGSSNSSSSDSSSYNLGCDVVDATGAPGAALRLVRVVDSSRFTGEIAAASVAQRPDTSVSVGDATTSAAVRGGGGPGTRVTHLAVELTLPAGSLQEDEQARLLQAALGRVSAAVRRTGGFSIEYDARALRPQPCAFQVCSVSGACVLDAGGFSAVCACMPGWSGATCDHQDGIPGLALGLGLAAGLAALLGVAALLRQQRSRAVKPGGPDFAAAPGAAGDQELPSGGPSTSTSSRARAPRVTPLPPRMPGLSEVSLGGAQATPKKSPAAPRSPFPLLPPRPILLSPSNSTSALRELAPAAAAASAGFAGDAVAPEEPQDAAASSSAHGAGEQQLVHEARTPTTPCAV
jgi:hypothetical protein